MKYEVQYVTGVNTEGSSILMKHFFPHTGCSGFFTAFLDSKIDPVG